MIRLFLFLGFSLLSSFAHASQLGILGGVSSYRNTTPGTQNNSGFIGGLSFSTPLSVASRTAVEIDALYDNREWANQDFQTLQIPAFIRYYIFKDLNIGFGGYYENSIGSATYFTKSEAGLDGSVQLRFRLHQRLSLVLDARYLYGLTHIGSGFESREADFLAGISFHI